jgi:hypothetical protein
MQNTAKKTWETPKVNVLSIKKITANGGTQSPVESVESGNFTIQPS